MPILVFNQLGLGAPRPTTEMLQLADRSIVHLDGMIEDVLLQTGQFIHPTYFIISYYEADEHVPIILGRLLLATVDAVIKVYEEKMIFRIDNVEIVLMCTRKFSFQVIMKTS